MDHGGKWGVVSVLVDVEGLLGCVLRGVWVVCGLCGVCGLEPVFEGIEHEAKRKGEKVLDRPGGWV